MPRKPALVYAAPKRVNNRGNIPLTISFPEIGKIRVSSGTTDPKTFNDIKEAMKDAHNVGNLTTLESIKNRVITPLEFLHSVRSNGVNRVITVDNTLPLLKTVQDWVETYPVKDTTRRGYKSHLKGFYEVCKSTDTLKDLAPRLEQYRKVCQKKGIHVSFNQCRTALLAFTRDEYKTKSALYTDVKAVDVLPVIRKVHNDAVSVEEMTEFTAAMSDPFPDIVWGMCFTGMRISEYLESLDTTWKVVGDSIEVINSNPGHGNKGTSRVLMLPFDIEKPKRKEKAIIRAFSKARTATGLSITPHTTRKCYARWCEEAGIIQSHIEAYMGHNGLTVTKMYQKHDVTKYLKEDAKKFRSYVKNGGSPQKTGKKMKMMQMGPYGMEEVEVDVT